MNPLNLIARYLLKEVGFAAGFVFLALLVLFSFFDLVNELGSMGRGGYGLAQVALYVLLSIPGHVYEIVPIAALIGTLFALSRLVMNSEFAVMRVSGISNWRISAYLGIAGFAFAMIAMGVGEFMAPWSEQAAQKLKLRATKSVVAQSFRSGLWVKDGNAFVNVREVQPDTSLRDIRIYEFNDRWELLRITGAENGVWQRNQRWLLEKVTDTSFTAEGIKIQAEKNRSWRSVLSPDILSVLLVAPERMATPVLLKYIRHLKVNKQKTSRYEMALWSKMLYPFTIPVMMLLALPFAFHSPRSGGISLKVFLGILAGLGFHLSNRLVAHVGLLNDWPPILTAVTPSLVFLGLTMGSIKWLERR